VNRATGRQLDYISSLGGDTNYARLLTKEAASHYIDLLKEKKRMEQQESVKAKPTTVIPLAMLEMTPSAHYAVRPDSTVPFTFLRVARPNHGKFKGCTKIQTRHGDTFVNRMVVYPSGSIWFDLRNKAKTETDVMLVIADYQQACLNYAREIGQCCICNKTLTDERSRWYGIGPDCETRHGWVIERTEEEDGEYYPGRERE
jgi:hypothetical protein